MEKKMKNYRDYRDDIGVICASFDPNMSSDSHRISMMSTP